MPVVSETHQLGKRALALGCECGQCLFWVNRVGSPLNVGCQLETNIQTSSILLCPSARLSGPGWCCVSVH